MKVNNLLERARVTHKKGHRSSGLKIVKGEEDGQDETNPENEVQNSLTLKQFA
jgi:hypothetical protein